MKWFCFIVTVLLMASVLSAGELLFDPTTGPVGTLRDDYTGSLGVLFKVNDHVSVSKLGFYDHGGNGLAASHVVRIWESSDNNGNFVVIAEATIPAGTGATLADGFRWVDLPTPVNLIRKSTSDANWYCLTVEVVNGSGDFWYNLGVTGFDYADYMYNGYWDARWGTSNQFPMAGAVATDAWYAGNMSAGLADKAVDVNVVSRTIDMSDFNGTTRFNASCVDNMRLAGITNIREPFSLGTVFSAAVVPSLAHWQANKDDPAFIASLNWYDSPHTQIVDAGFNWTLLILDMPPCLVNRQNDPNAVGVSVPNKDDIAAWTAFGEMCGVVYDHYKDMINYVEIGNEHEFFTNVTGNGYANIGYANKSEPAADYYYYAWQGISPTLEVGISGPGSWIEPWAWGVSGFDYIVGGRGGVPASPVTADMMDDVSVHIYATGNSFMDWFWDWARVRVDGGIWPSRWNSPVSNLAGKDFIISEWDWYWDHPFPGMSFYGNILNQMIKTGTKNYIYDCWETFGGYQWGTIAYDLYRQAGVFMPGRNVYVHDDPTHENTAYDNYTAVSLENGTVVLLGSNSHDTDPITKTWVVSNFSPLVSTDTNTSLLRVLDTADNPTGSNDLYDYELSKVSGSGNGYTVTRNGTRLTVTLTMEPDSINALVLHAARLITPTVYAVSSENVAGLDRDADYTVDGSGLVGDGSAGSTHAVGDDAISWTTAGSYALTDYDPYITYDLGGIYDVTQIREWGSNSSVGSIFGPDEVDIYTSTDGAAFTLATTVNFAQAPGVSGYVGNDIAVNLPAVRYIKLDIMTNHDGQIFDGSGTVTPGVADARSLVQLHEIRFEGKPNLYDGSGGMDDLAGFAAHWLDIGCVDLPLCGGADLNGNGDVDLNDFAIFASNWMSGI